MSLEDLVQSTTLAMHHCPVANWPPALISLAEVFAFKDRFQWFCLTFVTPNWLVNCNSVWNASVWNSLKFQTWTLSDSTVLNIHSDFRKKTDFLLPGVSRWLGKLFLLTLSQSSWGLQVNIETGEGTSICCRHSSDSSLSRSAWFLFWLREGRNNVSSEEKDTGDRVLKPAVTQSAGPNVYQMISVEERNLVSVC